MSRGVIILMEDDEALNHLYRITLEAAGYKVVAQSNSKNIVNLIETHKPQLVISDMVMPEFEGLEAIFKIIENYHIPIIAISAYENYLGIAESLVASCLLKPFASSRLVEEVNDVLEKYNKQ